MCYCWKAEMVRCGRIMCIIVRHVIFSNVDCQIDPFSIIVPIGLHFMLCGQFTRVAIMLVSSVFKGSTYGILYTTFEQSTSLKMVFLSLHLSRSSFFRSHNKISLNIFFMVIQIWLKIWRIVIKRLTMKLPFALGLLVLLVWNRSVH